MSETVEKAHTYGREKCWCGEGPDPVSEHGSAPAVGYQTCDSCGSGWPASAGPHVCPVPCAPAVEEGKPRCEDCNGEGYWRDRYDWVRCVTCGASGVKPEPAPTPEKSADEDEAAALDVLLLLPKANLEQRVAILARFRATAREQGRQAAQVEIDMARAEGFDAGYRDALEAGRQAGAEEMREACAYLLEQDPNNTMDWTSQGRRAADIMAAEIRALPLPEPSR